MQYQFTDTDLAAQRLEYLAGVYAESSRTFIRDYVAEPPDLALDLGCGPGHTTHMLADCFQNCRVVGVDRSERFFALADRTRTDRVSFCLHDVTAVPFPMGPADLVYCRYLLTHLKDPLEVLSRWGTQLTARGLLLVEEVEWIQTSNPAFSTYLVIVEAMLAHQETCLYTGPILDGLVRTHSLQKKTSQVKRLRVLNHQAATMFYLNIQSWKQQPFVRENYDSKVISELEQDLKALSTLVDSVSEIEWGLRQIVFERL